MMPLNSLSKTSLFILFLIVLGSPLNLEAQKSIEESVKKIAAMLQIIDRSYVDTTDSEDLAETAIIKMLEELDPHSVYISKEDVKKMNEPLVGNFEGVGIQFNILNDTILVVSPISGGPSEKLGIMAGDRIIKVDDENVAGIGVTNQMVMDRLRGKKGTKVEVEIHRRGVKNLIEFTITRDKIPIFSVDAGYMATPEIGYIKLNRFAQKSMLEIHQKLDTLEKQGMKHLILDLRGNGGGYLQTAIDLADEFLTNHKLIVYTEGRSFSKDEKFATSRGRFEKGKLAVLIDNGSASASEIVSGAVQDWDRGLVIGRRSFGKGLVQKPYRLPDGAVVRLTVQRYYTPTGRCIQKPYEDYKNDYFSRFERGEFFSKDSIDLPDSLIYFTPNDREVYGGGGIVPDVFVPIDTSMNSTYFSNLRRKGVFNSYTLQYLDENREEIQNKYPDITSFKKEFKVSDELLKEFINYAEGKKVEKDETGLQTSKPLIVNFLKALIARGIWKTDAYFQVVNQLNPIYQKAIEVLNDDTFDKMKVESK